VVARAGPAIVATVPLRAPEQQVCRVAARRAEGVLAGWHRVLRRTVVVERPAASYLEQASRRQIVDAVLDRELVRYADAIERLGQ